MRVESPSAEVQGHSASQKVTLGGKRQVGITELEQVGNYAVRVIFDDGHSTGIYSWPYLHRLGATRAAIWQAYLDAVTAQGLALTPAPLTCGCCGRLAARQAVPQPACRGGAAPAGGPLRRRAHDRRVGRAARATAILVAGDVFDGNLVPERAIVQALAAMR